MIRIRAATPEDREILRHRWVRCWAHGTGNPADVFRMGGGRTITRGLWRLMVERAVDDLLASSEVLVADLVTVPGEPVAWVAFSGTELRFVSVLGLEGSSSLRRRGVASKLLTAAFGDTTPTTLYTTEQGRALLESWGGRAAA